MVLNMCGFGPYMGLNSGLETLAAQAIGAKNMTLAGTYLQRGRIVVFSAFVPMMLCFAFSKHALIGLGQDKNVSEQAFKYILIMAPSILLIGLGDL